MHLVARLLTILVIALHVAFALAEILYWQHPAVMARFGTTPEFAKASAVLASNQGAYNALLAASLAWALVRSNVDMWQAMLWFVVGAGVYGGLTAKPTIFLVQAVPALLALGAMWMAARAADGRP